MSIEADWSFSGVALLEPWRRRLRGELATEPRFRSAAGPTRSERYLWEALEARAEGWQREYTTGRYRLDFFLPSHKLAVEVDGSSHDGPVRRAADEQRDVWHLERFGIVTARFTVSKVMHDRDGVLAEIDRRMAAPRRPVAVLVDDRGLSESGEVPVAVVTVQAVSIELANARVEDEIVMFSAKACVTVLPVLPQRKSWTRVLERFR